MNKYVSECDLLHRTFNIRVIPISYKTGIEDIRVFSYQKIITIIKTYLKLISSLIGFKPEFIYFQISPLGMAFFRDCTFILIIKFFRKPILFHLHGKGINEFVEQSFFRKKVYRWAFKNSNVICLSDKLTYDIAHIYRGKPFIVNNAIPELGAKGQPLRKQLQSLRILFLSNLYISKGIYDYLDAVSLLRDKQIKLEALIVGNEAELKHYVLLKEIEKRNLSNCVLYLGALYGDSKNEIYINSDILVYPSYNDAWGLVILEAMRSGLAVVATNEGAISEIVDNGVTGFIVDKHRPDQIAEKLEILISNPELRRQMGSAGRCKFLEKYTLDKFEKNLSAVFSDVLHKNAQSI